MEGTEFKIELILHYYKFKVISEKNSHIGIEFRSKHNLEKNLKSQWQ